MFCLDESSFVDPIDFIQRIATKHHRSVRLVSSTDRKRLQYLLKKHRNSLLLITDIHLIKHFLFEIQVNIIIIVIWSNISLN